MNEITKNYIYNLQLNLNARTTIMKLKANKQLIKIDQQSMGKCFTSAFSLSQARHSF